jgi:hypothetical protein
MIAHRYGNNGCPYVIHEFIEMDVFQVPERLFNTLAAFRELAERQPSMRLARTAAVAVFPTPEGLREVENKFGGTVSLGDIYGQTSDAAHQLEAAREQLHDTLDKTSTQVGAAMDVSKLLAATQLKLSATSALHSDALTHLLDKSDNQPLRDERQATALGQSVSRASSASLRTERNFVAANIAAVDEASQQLELQHKAAATHSVQEFPAALPAPPGGQVYMYAGQRLNTRAWQMGQLRQQLAASHEPASYSYSPEFASATLSLVDEHAAKAAAEAADRAAWMTKRGFVYPVSTYQVMAAYHIGISFLLAGPEKQARSLSPSIGSPPCSCG